MYNSQHLTILEENEILLRCEYNLRRELTSAIIDTSTPKCLRGQTLALILLSVIQRRTAASCVKMLLEQWLPEPSAPPPSSGSNLYVHVLTVGRSRPSGLV